MGGSYFDHYLYYLFGCKRTIDHEIFYHLIQGRHIWMSRLIDVETGLLQYKGRDNLMSINVDGYPGYPISRIRFHNVLRK